MEARQKKAKIYIDLLGDKIEHHGILEGVTTSFYSFLIMLPSKEKRDTLKQFLLEQGIETKLWKPVHLQPAYSGSPSFPNAEYIFEHHLRLPIHNLMTEDEIEYVVNKTLEVIE